MSNNIICQGSLGAYSNIFANQFFHQPNLTFVNQFEEVMIEMSRGNYNYGVLPIENSTAGSVDETYRLLKKYNLYIVACDKIRISHCLLSTKGNALDNINTIISHPQALLQCSRYINSHDYNTINSFNTAIASKDLSSCQDKSKAVIASDLCAAIYDLDILERNIQNEQNNFTKFIVISNTPNYIDSSNVINFCCTINNQKNSLLKLLTLFTKSKVNLLSIQSKNIPNTIFNVVFYIEFEGNLKDNNIRKLLAKLDNYCEEHSVLGNYYIKNYE